MKHLNAPSRSLYANSGESGGKKKMTNQTDSPVAERLIYLASFEFMAHRTLYHYKNLGTLSIRVGVRRVKE